MAALLAGIMLAACGGSADAPPPPSTGPVLPTPPTITQQPVALTVTVGQPATFTIAATGTAPLAYQWQRNGVVIADATTTSYTLATTTLADSGAAFRAVASNVAGSATSNAATLTVATSAPVLTITPQPTNVSVVAGASATFTVGGTCSSGTLNIQWQRLAGGAFANIAGATSTSYGFATVAADTGTQFRAVLDCSGQSSTPSSVATLTVTAPGSLSLDLVPVVGLRGAAQIGNPLGGITRLPNGDYWYTDGNRIRRLSADLTTITTIAGAIGTTGSTDGPAAIALFRSPADLAADATGIVYVLDSQNGTIRKIAIDGTVSTIAGTPLVTGTADGTGAAAQFNNPRAIALGPDGDLYVADGNNAIRRVTVAGVVTTYAGNHTSGLVDNANPANAQFNGPDGIAVAANNDVYVADAGNSRIRRIARAGSAAGAVTSIAGASNAFDTAAADGPGASAGIPDPFGMTIVGNTLYVRDRRGLLRVIDLATNVVSTLTGNRVDGGGNIDGPLGHAQLDDLTGYLTAMPGGGFVITDRNRLRTVSVAGAVTTVATSSTNTLGQPDDALGVLSQLPLQFAGNVATSVAIDPANNIVTYDGTTHSIRRIDPSGNVSLVAGLIGGYGPLGASGFPIVDGPGSGATFNDAGLAIATAASGTIYVSDSYGLRRVDPAGNVVLLSGSRDTFGAVNGNASTSRYNRIAGLAVAANGDVFAGDFGNNVIRRIDTAGNSTSYAGVMGASGQVNGPTAAARFQAPRQLAIQSDGTLYTSDNGTLRRVSADGSTVSTTPVFSVSAIGVDSLGNVYCNPNGAFARYSVDGTVTTLIPASGGAVVTGSVAPNVGTGVTAIAMRGDKQIVIIAEGQLLQVNLP